MGSLEEVQPMGLIGVPIWLSPFGPKLEVEVKIRKAGY